MSSFIVVPGKFDIFVACNFAYTAESGNVVAQTVRKLGELADELQIQVESVKYPVPGDRHGGRQGDPIEEQFLSQIATCNLELSEFDPAVANALTREGGLIATPGLIPQASIGGLLRRNNSYRFTFRPVIDTAQGRNFPCTIVKNISIAAGGVKFRMLTMSLEMHRTPTGHWGGVGAENVLFDSSYTGLPA